MANQRGMMTQTGHIIGGTYYSPSHEMRYTVEGTATLWDLSPHTAVRLRWENGNCTVSCEPCRDNLLVVAPAA